MTLASWTDIVALALIGAVQPANSDDAGCSKFAWPLTHEKTLFAAADKRRADAGAELTAMSPAAVVMSLKSAAQATFTLPPERKPRSETWFGGTLRLPALEAGSYQVTLSEEA